MIDIHNLTVKRGRNTCLHNVNFCFAGNRGVIGLIGPNGAGKTTLIDCILGNLRGTDGSNVHIAFRHIGYATDVPDLPTSLTIVEAIEYTAILKRVPRPDIRKLLKKVGLLAEGTGRVKTVGELSRGLRQRLAIACALVGDPELLILDEPTSALDPMGREEVLSLIESEGKLRLILVSSHLLSDIESISTELIILNHGKILFSGHKSKLLEIYSDSSLQVSVTIAQKEVKLFTQLLSQSGINYKISKSDMSEYAESHESAVNTITSRYILDFLVDPNDERKLFRLLADCDLVSSVQIRIASKNLTEIFHQLVQQESVDA